MGSNCSVILCSIIVLCFIQDFVNCDGEFLVDFSSIVNHGDQHGDAQSSAIETKIYDQGGEKGNNGWDQGKFQKYLQEWGDFGKDNQGIKIYPGNSYDFNGKNS